MPIKNDKTITKKILIRGTVQGIGFRPAVHRIAARLRLTGSVANTSAGAEIILEGPANNVNKFIPALKKQLPPASKITSLTSAMVPARGFKNFTITDSSKDKSTTADLPPDLATCPKCLRELFTSSDRRYRYPFINCTECGPRYTISTGLPYDRPETTMADFSMCAACEKEYQSAHDRRFHAQPNACGDCGPQLTLMDKQWHVVAKEDEAVARSVEYLQKGKILAVKSLGGYHLACDARNPNAIACLRMRKQRPHKPFAVMLPDIAAVHEYCHVSKAERTQLLSAARPIVLLRKKIRVARLSLPLYDIAPDNAYMGVMLPYTPLHNLLFRPAMDRAWRPRALIMTSGNRSDEPICSTEPEARSRLAGIADFLLTNDRPIHNRADDSIVQVMPSGNTVVVRRSRGFAPRPVTLSIPGGTPAIFAAGAELKNTFCLTRGSQAYISPYIGDLDSAEALSFYRESFERNKKFLDVNPAIIAHDLHPDYHSTIFARELRSKDRTLKRIAVQHHQAHIASVMAEHRQKGPLTGIAFDGTGLGLDGTIWGGECFTVNAAGVFERGAHIGYFALPGGDIAAREIWRLAVSLLHQSGISKVPKHLKAYPVKMTRQMIQKNMNSPRCCSVGRLFDAVAAIINLRTECSFEAQAAMEMEALAVDTPTKKGYNFVFKDGIVPVEPIIQAVYADFMAGVPSFEISASFHLTLSRIIIALAEHFNNRTVALSGGVFQNRVLLDLAEKQLLNAGFKVYYNNSAPINDGGISLGQAYIAAKE